MPKSSSANSIARHTRAVLLLAFCFFVQALPLYASESISSVAFDGESGIDQFLQVLFALLCVIILIVALSMVVKKYNILPGSQSNQIAIISTMPLGNKDRLLLIKVGDDHLLIAASPGNISKLHKLKDYSEPDLARQADVTSAVPGSQKGKFQSLMSTINVGRAS